MASSPERSTTAAFDRYVAESQSRSRSRSGSANSTSLIASSSLPPPPRPKRVVGPASPSPLTLPGSSPPNKDSQVQMSGSNPPNWNGFSSSRPVFLAESAAAAAGPGTGPGSGSSRRPNPSSAVYGISHPSERRSSSFSSANSYSNLFYKPSSDYIPTAGLPGPNSNPPRDSLSRDSQALSFEDTISIEDYSALLYPDLQSAIDSPRSQRPSLEVHGPPTRKRIPSFASEEREGPESPVEFAELRPFSTQTAKTTQPPASASSTTVPSKADRLLGTKLEPIRSRDSKPSTDEGRRDSFMDFDSAHGETSSSSHSGKPSVHRSSPVSAEFPMFAVRRMESIEVSQPNKTLNEYRAMVDSIRAKGGDPLDLSPRQESRQVFVDGSDLKRSLPTRPGASPVGMMESIVNQSPNSSMPGSPASNRPPTSNLLDQKERADLVRKTRKIVQVLGPGVTPVVQAIPRPLDSSGLRREALHRATRSDVSPLDDPQRDSSRGRPATNDVPSSSDEPKHSWEPLNRETLYLSGSERRHSSPSTSTFSPDIHKASDSDAASLSSLGSIITPEKRAERKGGARSGSPTSFMELTDEEGAKTPKLRPSAEIKKDSERPSTDTAVSGGKDTRHTGTNSPASTAKHHVARKPSLTSSLSLSLSDEDKDAWGELWKDMTKQDDDALERQRKREKLARIHRYLGSRVPPELVLGTGSVTPPPGPTSNDHQHNVGDGSVGSVTEWKRRRRSLSAATYRSWELKSQMELEMRSKDTLSNTDRVLHVRRAQKIEQILGEQAFYQIPRPATAPLQHPFQDADETQSQSPSQTQSQGRRLQKPDPEQQPFSSRQYKQRSASAWKDGRPSTSSSSYPSTAQSRPSTAQSQTQAHSMMGYPSKGPEGNSKHNKIVPTEADNNHESQTLVIPAPTLPANGTALDSPWENVNLYDVLDISPRSLYAQSSRTSKAPVEPSVRTSRQFLDYKNSLNSLNRILDNDDVQSLHELHTVLSSDEEEEAEGKGPEQPHVVSAPGNLQNRYIKPRASLLSIESVATVSSYATLTPEPMTFQARRKRAAKLAHFFGASYRDLFGEVLNQIERGMLEEARLGEMSREEMRQLLDQLNRLKSRQSQIST